MVSSEWPQSGFDDALEGDLFPRWKGAGRRHESAERQRAACAHALGLEPRYVAEARARDCIYVPPYVVHQEINAGRDEVLECVLVRLGQEPVVVNLDIVPVEVPDHVKWIEPIHSQVLTPLILLDF